MVIAVVGDNTYDAGRHVKAAVDEFEAKYGTLTIERVDAEEASLEQIKEALSSLPFLAERKLVVLKNLGFNKAAAEDIEQIISSIIPEVEVIIYDQIIDKRTGYYKTLKTKTDFNEYQNSDPKNLTDWLVRQAQDCNAELSRANAKYLVERVGSNQQLLANEIQKLSLYSRQISRDSINLLTVETPQGKIFDLLDAAFSGNKLKALTLYEQQRSMRVEPQEIMAMLAWQLRLLAAAETGKERPAGQVAKDLGISPFPLSKAQGLMRKIGPRKLAELVDQATEIDQKAKTSSIDLDEALKTYITSL